jgi:hypothetical protein
MRPCFTPKLLGRKRHPLFAVLAHRPVNFSAFAFQTQPDGLVLVRRKISRIPLLLDFAVDVNFKIGVEPRALLRCCRTMGGLEVVTVSHLISSRTRVKTKFN